MKKKYMIPETAVFNVSLQHIIAESPFSVNPETQQVTSGTLMNDNATGAAMGRDFGFFDDDE